MMHNLLGSNCKEIKITVDYDYLFGLAQTNSDVSYDLDNAKDVKSLEAAMSHLTIGQTLKI